MTLAAKMTLAAATLLVLAQQAPRAAAFLASPSAVARHRRAAATMPAVRRSAPRPLLAKEEMQGGDDPMLDEMFGGFTAKQRLREEIESPFRTVRLTLLGASTGSAFIAL